MAEYYRKWLDDPNSVPGSCECHLADRRGNIKDVFVTMAMIPGTRIGVASLLNITERKRAEETVIKLSRRNELILNAAGEGIFGLDLDGNHTFVNPSAAKMLGYEVQELTGKPSHTILHHTKADGSPYPEDECPIYAAYKKGFTHRITDEVFWRRDGTSFFVEYTSTPIFEDDSIIGAVIAFNDISERKKAENVILKVNRTLRVLSSCNEVLIRSKDEMELLNRLCKTIVELGEYRMCWVGYAEYGPSSPLRPVAHAGCDDYLETLKETWSRKGCDQRPECSAIRTGKVVICNNIMTDPQFEDWRDEAVKCGYSSAIALPLAENSQTFGVLIIHASEPDAFDQDERDLLTQLANDLAYGIVSLRTRAARSLAEEALKKGEIELKKRVKELEEFYNIDVGRELRMKELKEEIESLKDELERCKKPLT
jgi:PAS domain S-box-containing protein